MTGTITNFEAAAHLKELTDEFREAHIAYLAARTMLYGDLQQVIDAGLSKSEVARITGLSRVTIDRVLAGASDDQADDA